MIQAQEQPQTTPQLLPEQSCLIAVVENQAEMVTSLNAFITASS